MTIVIWGDPKRWNYIGPFSGLEEANETWWVIELEKPE